MTLEQPGEKRLSLLPCPFCGTEPTMVHGATDDYQIVCRGRGCFGPITSAYAFSSDAIAAWNLRSPPAEMEAVADDDGLRGVLDAIGKKQSELAHVLGSRSRAAEYLNGKRELSKGAILKICKAWGVSSDVLLGLKSTTAQPLVDELLQSAHNCADQFGSEAYKHTVQYRAAMQLAASPAHLQGKVGTENADRALRAAAIASEMLEALKLVNDIVDEALSGREDANMAFARIIDAIGDTAKKASGL